MVKTPLKASFNKKGSFSIKLTKIVKETGGEMFCTFAGLMSLMLNSLLCNLIVL